MPLAHAVVLVTRANRGIGPAFAREALARGARVYAGARDPASVQLAGVQRIRLDVTQPDDVQRAARALEAGAEEILADEVTRQVKQSLSSPAAAYLAPVP